MWILIASVVVLSGIVILLRGGLKPAQQYALIDLVETHTAAENRHFINLATGLADEVGGNTALVNTVTLPTIVPDPVAAKRDQATGLLLITEYPSRQAVTTVIAQREQTLSPQFTGAVRTFAAKPVTGVEALFTKYVPAVLGMWNHQKVPTSAEVDALPELIEAAHVLNSDPENGIYSNRWAELIAAQHDKPLWMLNFLEFSEQAHYKNAPAKNSANKAPATGELAYQRYGRGMIGSLAAVGGRIAWSGTALAEFGDNDDGNWHQIAVAVYPSTTAMMTMLATPEYQAAHKHRVAGLKRTRLLATQPLGQAVPH